MERAGEGRMKFLWVLSLDSPNFFVGDANRDVKLGMLLNPQPHCKNLGARPMPPTKISLRIIGGPTTYNLHISIEAKPRYMGNVAQIQRIPLRGLMFKEEGGYSPFFFL